MTAGISSSSVVPASSTRARQQSFFFEGYVQSFQQSPLDAAEIIVEYRDASNTAVLSSYDTGQVRQANNWLREADTRMAPVGTRWIRVRLIATRSSGDNNDGYFDGLSLRAGNTGIASVLDGPRGLAFAPDGSLYVADTEHHQVQRIDVGGRMTTIAGTGQPGFAGDGGAAIAARLNRPSAVAVAPDGALYIADTGNLRIRKVSNTGNINTLTGTGTNTSTGNGGTARVAAIGTVEALALGPDGTLFFAESSTHRVRAIGVDGIVRAIAGTGTAGSGGDGGPANSAQLSGPAGLAVARDGSVYIADTGSNRLRVVTPSGRIVALAGTGSSGAGGDGGPGLAAQLYGPTQLALGPDGAVHVTDSNNAEVRRIAPALPALSSTDVLVAASNGEEVYRFRAHPGRRVVSSSV